MREVVVRFRAAGFQLQGLPIAGRGFFELALDLLSDAQIVMKLRVMGTERDGLADPVDAFIVPAGLVGEHAEKMQRGSVGRIACEEAAADFLRLPWLAVLEQLPS